MLEITEQQYKEAAGIIGCDVACIKAVKQVEANGSGFMPDGSIKILFEPHVFWEQLKKVGIKPTLSDICYPNWQPGKYGAYSVQWKRLIRAKAIHKEAALKSASWGLFQVMGYNYGSCGYASVFEMINLFGYGEHEHLKAFAKFIVNRKLAVHLVNKEWGAFALGYNGKGYKANKYDEKLEAAYKSFL